MNEDTITELRQELDPALVSQREGGGGRMLDYIEGHVAIDQANRIFGYDGWSYNVDEVTFVPELGAAGGYISRVTVTVGDAVRGDVGYWEVGTKRDTGEIFEGAHELAYKSAATDGLKRALRTFGSQFGNSLYGSPASQSSGNAPQSSQNGQSATQHPPMRICPECGKQAVIKGKEEYGGGWICWKKRDGCGASYPDDFPGMNGTTFFAPDADLDDYEDLTATLEKAVSAEQFNVAMMELRRIKGSQDALSVLKEVADDRGYGWDDAGKRFTEAEELEELPY